MFRAGTKAQAPKLFTLFRWNPLPSARNTVFVRGGFAILAALADFLAILTSGVLARLFYTSLGFEVDTHIRLGLLVAVLFIFMSAMRDDYAITNYLTFERQELRSIMPWCMAAIGALLVSLYVKPVVGTPTLAAATFVLGGLCTMNLVRLLITYAVRTRVRQGKLAVRRVFLLGYETELAAFTKTHEPCLFGIHVVAASVLRGPENLEEDLALALAAARIHKPDDVFVLVPWSDKKVIDAAIQALRRIPASIHLGSERVLEGFSNARISKIGPVPSLNLVRDPLSMSEIFAKRVFDIVFATIALILLAPTFVIVAIAIKLDSPGPIIFSQRRCGFNQQQFRMFKFRSMHTLEDDAKLAPVIENDPRVTRVGRFIRHHNLDELPQLFNVLLGDMSLVGPRPHAVSIDQKFARRIAPYARRYTVKPGITGWAQINGLRGRMLDQDMKARVEHDLHYIDHWSIWFDIEILCLTLTSEMAYETAF
jgi:Undecaprenyl-phosphate glucose phosphotransferase